MKIERTEDEVIFRVSADTDIDDLQAIADLLKYKELTQKINVSQEQVDELVKEVKKGRLERTRSKIGS
ncbi:hypothetical protein EON73_05675 [bacterium]|nr:MAG: hypothetical protein EON73_05675 [bacterium]